MSPRREILLIKFAFVFNILLVRHKIDVVSYTALASRHSRQSPRYDNYARIIFIRWPPSCAWHRGCAEGSYLSALCQFCRAVGGNYGCRSFLWLSFETYAMTYCSTSYSIGCATATRPPPSGSSSYSSLSCGRPSGGSCGGGFGTSSIPPISSSQFGSTCCAAFANDAVR